MLLSQFRLVFVFVLFLVTRCIRAIQIISRIHQHMNLFIDAVYVVAVKQQCFFFAFNLHFPVHSKRSNFISDLRLFLIRIASDPRRAAVQCIHLLRNIIIICEPFSFIFFFYFCVSENNDHKKKRRNKTSIFRFLFIDRYAVFIFSHTMLFDRAYSLFFSVFFSLLFIYLFAHSTMRSWKFGCNF